MEETVHNLYNKYPVTIHSITNETEDKNLKTFELHFMSPEDDENKFFFQPGFQPGQFAMLWVPGFGEIPVGIASSPTEKNKLLFTVNKIGKVTGHLHTLNRGAILGVRGPLGNGFPWQDLKGKHIALIGGGYAFTTLRSSIVYLLDPVNRDSFGDIRLFYGARIPGMLLYRDELDTWATRDDLEVHISVDMNNISNWKHYVGNIPSIVTQELPQGDEDSVAIVCGPPIMIKFALLALREKGYSHDQVYLSLENRMKCGIGHCGRCTIGKDSVCSDGPVFSMAEVEKMPNDF
jgi:sulfhydrogenase subunit gamma (sulfur reductase)